MTAYEIPLNPAPQAFKIVLGGKKYQLTVRWNSPSSSWTLDIAQEDGTPILNGLALVTGADLLEPFGYLNFGGQLICKSDGNSDETPFFDNLGTTSHVFWVTA